MITQWSIPTFEQIFISSALSASFFCGAGKGAQPLFQGPPPFAGVPPPFSGIRHIGPQVWHICTQGSPTYAPPPPAAGSTALESKRKKLEGTITLLQLSKLTHEGEDVLYLLSLLVLCAASFFLASGPIAHAYFFSSSCPFASDRMFWGFWRLGCGRPNDV